MRILNISFYTGLSLLVALQISAANDTIRVDQISQDGGNIVIVVDLTTPDPTAEFTAQYAEDLGTSSGWLPLTGAVFTPIFGIPGRHRMVAPEPAGLGVSRFYRVFVSTTTGTADDTDGDGLTNSFEIAQSAGLDANDPDRMDPNLFDTDGDGASDGFEFFVGTKPNDPNDTPTDTRQLPAAEFSTPLSSIQEGDGTFTIPIMISKSYSGPINYVVSDRSNAVAGVDYVALSGATTASAGFASIELNLIDDLAITNTRQLMIDIEPISGQYRAGGTITKLVNITDDDAYWTGVLTDGTSERNFRICLAQNASTTQIEFRSGDEDGLLRPDSGASSQSTGVIPDVDLNGAEKEIWPSDVGVAAYDPSQGTTGLFHAGVDLMPVHDGSFPHKMKRRLVLDVVASNGDDASLPGRIFGTYNEQIRHQSNPAITYLDRDFEGEFVLLRDIPQSEPIASPLHPSN